MAHHQYVINVNVYRYCSPARPGLDTLNLRIDVSIHAAELLQLLLIWIPHATPCCLEHPLDNVSKCLRIGLSQLCCHLLVECICLRSLQV
jgi:hypothetical protein